MSEEKAIKDFDFYTSEMEKGMKDKLFFLNFLHKGSFNFLDYGCANGKTLEAISLARNPKKERDNFDTFFGYDNSEEMIRLARLQWQGNSNKVKFESDWSKIPGSGQTVLILSSVLHEIYSYKSQEEIELFWKQIFDANPQYIVIRDMCWSRDMDRKMTDDVYVPLYNYEMNYHFISNFAKNSTVEKWQIDEFEDKWGPITNVKTFLHLLLKYRYVVNWERELRENYFALEDVELFKRIQNPMYNIIYMERFQLPTIEKFTKIKYGDNNINDNTHVKIILKRKEK